MLQLCALLLLLLLLLLKMIVLIILLLLHLLRLVLLLLAAAVPAWPPLIGFNVAKLDALCVPRRGPTSPVGFWCRNLHSSKSLTGRPHSRPSSRSCRGHRRPLDVAWSP